MTQICSNKYRSSRLLSVLLPVLIIICSVHAPAFADTNNKADHSKRTVHFSYNVTVKNIPPESGHLAIWLPIPKSDNLQTVSGLSVSSVYPYTIGDDPEYSNSILTIKSSNDIPESISVSMDFFVTRNAFKASYNYDTQNDAVPPADLQRYLLADRLVPVDSVIAERAEKVVKDNMTALEKAKTLYDHVVSTMVYDKSGKGWGRGDALYACDSGKGNCTDFHSLFIAMARASGLPSRFVIGFPIPAGKKQGNIYGYHCWAEFYIKGLGWIPVDASEASKYSEKRDFFFGGLDANRVQFTVGRDIRIRDNPEIEPINYFIYPYVMIDGKAYSDIEYHFEFKDVSSPGEEADKTQ